MEINKKKWLDWKIFNSMSRKNKFRIWDRAKNIWITDKPIDDICYRGTSLNELLNRQYYVFQQFTNLKDKDGAEIYEGDIVSSPVLDFCKDDKGELIIGSNGDPKTKINDRHILIVWSDETASYVGKESDNNLISSYGWDIHDGFATRCKVIGNIFDNPNLFILDGICKNNL